MSFTSTPGNLSRVGEDRVPQWDFFVSYTEQDRRWAEWIAWQLEDAGYRVLLQAWDVIPGTSWPLGMQEGIRYSERTVVVVSTAYLRSVYGEQEWRAAQSADPRGFERKLVPVRVEDCELPGLLGEIVSFDIFDTGAQRARSHFLEQISIIFCGRVRPAEPPLYPGRSGRPSPRAARGDEVVLRPAAVADHTGRVLAVAFAYGGSALATGAADRMVIVWEVAAGAQPRRTATLTGYSGQVTGLAFGGPDDALLAAGSADWTVTFWDVSDPSRPVRRSAVRAHRGRVTAVAFAPHGRYLATGGADGVVKMWDVGDPAHPSEAVAAPVHVGEVTSASFTADGGLLATCGTDGAVVLWDTAEPGRPRQVATLAGDGAKAVAALAADGSLLVVGQQGGIFTVWDLADPSRPARLASHPAHPDSDVTAVAFDPADSTVLASGGSDGLVVVWDLGVPAEPARAAASSDHRGRIEALAFSPDGHILATGSADTTVGLWTLG